MSAYAINKLGYRVTDADDLRARGAQLADELGLSAEERRAALAGDVPSLHRMGVHPLIVCKLAILNGVDLRTAFAPSPQARARTSREGPP